MLKIVDLSSRFGGKIAVDKVNLSIEKGAFIGVIGHSGAGKSTLLLMINRLQDPSDGRILFNDTDVTALKGAALYSWRARCALIHQQSKLAGYLDVLTNVMTGRINPVPLHRSLLRWWTAEDRAIALSALEHFDIADLAARRADRLTAGQQQLVAVARALVQEPELLLADEPTATPPLDPRNTKVVMDALQLNRHSGTTVLCNLHSLELARGYCDRVVGMAAGRVRVRRCSGRADREHRAGALWPGS